jgi:hypothetical protein
MEATIAINFRALLTRILASNLNSDLASRIFQLVGAFGVVVEESNDAMLEAEQDPLVDDHRPALSDIITHRFQEQIRGMICLPSDIWQATIFLASIIPPQHPVRAGLDQTFHKLGALHGAWSLKDNNSLSFKTAIMAVCYVGSDGTYNESLFPVATWLNLSSFLARHSMTWTGIADFALWALRDGLECDLSLLNSPEPLHTRLSVAIAWLLERSDVIYELSKINHVLDIEGSYDGGPLFRGPSNFSLERWGFWKRRLEELRQLDSNELDLKINCILQKIEALERQGRQEREIEDSDT